MGSLCPIGASGSDNKETHLKKNMKRQNNLYTLNGRFLSSSLQRNPLFASITNVRFLSTNLQNNPLFAPIPHEYVRDKQKVLNVYFNIN